MFRSAAVDDVLPLSEPVKTTYGQLVNEIPIPKGLQINASVECYHRYDSYTARLIEG
jgi:hypothetical protein